MERPIEAEGRARDWTLRIAAGSLLASVAAAGTLARQVGWQPEDRRPDSAQVHVLTRSAIEAAESYLHAWCAGRPDLADQLAIGLAREHLVERPWSPDAVTDGRGCTRRPGYLVDETHYGQDGSVRLLGDVESSRGKRSSTLRADLLVTPGEAGWRVRSAQLSAAGPSAPAAAQTEGAP